MFFVYILYSATKNRFYIGQTDNIESRLKSHLSGISSYTSSAKDWKVAYFEEYSTRNEAIKRENEIKKKKSRKYIEWIISTKK